MRIVVAEASFFMFFGNLEDTFCDSWCHADKYEIPWVFRAARREVAYIGGGRCPTPEAL